MVTVRLFVCTCILFLLPSEFSAAQQVNKNSLCLDGFCIGDSINDAHFASADWILPKKGFTKQACTGVGCRAQVAFRGYSAKEQQELAEALSWNYGANRYNIITKANVTTLRHYKYECNPSARGMNGERRFVGAYLSVPSKYLTVIGLRLIGGELRVYRIARQYPYHNQTELTSLARQLKDEYGNEILHYSYLSSNAYSDVIQQKKNGWFGRSTLFTPNDLADNAAELVLIDPRTRPLLQPTSMPESGEIQSLPVHFSERQVPPPSARGSPGTVRASIRTARTGRTNRRPTRRTRQESCRCTGAESCGRSVS